MAGSENSEIRDLLGRYFEGLYHSDSKVLRSVFHADLSYVNGTAGTYEQMGLEAYMARIDARTPPASRGDPREEVIERIALKGERIGVVEARMTMMGRNYQDLLTLINTEGGWRVLTKVFSFVERKD
ncbi:nuclear transport factor 2 family protein [Phaeobacter gallaeciensis]|uniref:Lumazine-binding protein n=1 Tax=Phaeobacter gallaeciensis TaxID=60890 RepID=A0AAC9ZCG0_9RHOB|nr:nuclear transport factor 2 family protein [Phaeobacter gallaeciensis]AHD11547.1 Putative lumazine-binding protein [Phaeobacter gallaeciensis DSM 26640]ATE94811.1 Putative lumazine-binding protein [Phaeobacter gallaeciensis]ATE99083.1 Putative lumazine-binding protein [Phaeobacter gallaeciensis]ATF03475.1 Putative lumazine-binding protein [Phaeobacter gallaeciensis]ATF07855.1 Putative lumazine-binding protein [Phaeobacter gallaeciensis]